MNRLIYTKCINEINLQLKQILNFQVLHIAIVYQHKIWPACV